VALSASVAASNISNTIKVHVTCGHASGRRVHGAFKHANRGGDIFSFLPCLCPICAVTKSETPGHRKFERYFQHTDIDATKIHRELGWKPSGTFEEGLSATIDWYLSNETWLRNVTSGAYMDYYSAQYGA
jgi:dTDP-glucose 4,6-dehydratase